MGCFPPANLLPPAPHPCPGPVVFLLTPGLPPPTHFSYNLRYLPRPLGHVWGRHTGGTPGIEGGGQGCCSTHHSTQDGPPENGLAPVSTVPRGRRWTL